LLLECFPLGSQLGVFIFPCLCRDCGLAVHYAFEIIFRRRKQDLLRFGLLVPVGSGNGFTFVLPLFRVIDFIPVPVKNVLLFLLRSPLAALVKGAYVSYRAEGTGKADDDWKE